MTDKELQRLDELESKAWETFTDYIYRKIEFYPPDSLSPIEAKEYKELIKKQNKER